MVETHQWLQNLHKKNAEQWSYLCKLKNNCINFKIHWKINDHTGKA